MHEDGQHHIASFMLITEKKEDRTSRGPDCGEGKRRGSAFPPEKGDVGRVIIRGEKESNIGIQAGRAKICIVVNAGKH